MALSVEEFERRLRAATDAMTDLNPILTRIGGELVNEIKSAAPSDTGKLKNSIKAVIENDSLAIEMLYYGIFQNYGVDGTEAAPATEVPEYGVMQPEEGNRFAFGLPTPNKGRMISGESGLNFGARETIYRMGLKPQPFFDVDDIAQRVATGITEQLTTDF